MKREIKFRAWDKDMKEMVFVSGIQFDSHSPKEKPNIIDQRNDIRDLEDIELLQFTGLKDKNGKDIYEGDVCRKIQREQQKPELFYLVKSPVTFWKGSFEFFSEPLSNVNTDDYEEINSIEVIGNIYENPELLNK